ncbi:MAG: MATE family efflux transporter [Syntrophomonadaceae bacterium]|nr:MATE family efflux transporter [Syntrophomonadaceae bacterium]
MKYEKSSNRLLHRALLLGTPAGVVAALTYSFYIMTDAMLAGMVLSPAHIACVGVVAPVNILVTALLDILGMGSSLALVICIGRGDRKGANRMFSLGLTSLVALGAVIVGACLLWAEEIVGVYGARTAETVALSAAYLRFFAPAFLLDSLNFSLMKTLRGHGRNAESLVASIANLVLKVLFSYALIRYSSLGLAGLGLGSTLSQAAVLVFLLVVLYRSKTGLHFGFFRYRWAEIKKVVKLALPSCGDQLADSVVACIINNILVSMLGILSLAVYAVVKSMRDMICCVGRGVGWSSSPLFGLLYGVRDNNGIKRVFSSSFWLGLAFTAVWAGAVLATMPLWLKLFGISAGGEVDPALIRQGVYIVAAFFPLQFLCRQLTVFFEATERFGRSLLNAVTADSIIFPLLLLLLLPMWGYVGLWLSWGLAFAVFYLCLYAWMCWQNKSPVISLDQLLSLPSMIREHVPKLDISVRSREQGVGNIAERVQEFLNGEGIERRTAYITALCLEELAADMVSHAQRLADMPEEYQELLDIKLFVENGQISVNIRNAAQRYNPLDFELDDETFAKVGVRMAQKMAHHIEYNYMYKLNVIDIVI